MERKEEIKKTLVEMFRDYYDCAERFMDFLNDEYGDFSEEEHEEEQEENKENNDLSIFIEMLEELTAS